MYYYRIQIYEYSFLLLCNDLLFLVILYQIIMYT